MITEALTATLILENGMEFSGYSVGKQGTVFGEIVFTTGMTGFQETLTDPRGYGQLVTQTFPLVGNYGVNSVDRESDRCFLSGYIVREWCELPSNFRMEDSINHFLEQENVVGIYGIDTRALTKIIRENGVMNGAITTETAVDKQALLKQIKEFHLTKAVSAVSCKEAKTYGDDHADKHVVLFDFGYQFSVREELIARGCKVTVVPHTTTAKELEAMKPDGLLLSTGPGDPAENVAVIENLKEVMKLEIPTFAIGLGHQLVSLAHGAKTEKMLHGHRGANQPVIDVDLNRTFVTSQNHGYVVVGDSLDKTVGYVSHKNANDGSCEGIRYHNRPVFTMQFDPKTSGGAQDTSYLFDEFIQLMQEVK